MTSAEPQRAPQPSARFFVASDELENPVLRDGVAYWHGLKAGRKLPAPSDLSPREMASLLRHIVLLRVLDGGRDYEYRIAGDAHVEAYGHHLRGTRISECTEPSPDLGKAMHGLYEHVRTTAQPFALRGSVGRNNRDFRFVYFESALLPLGEDGETVDHILIVSIYVPRLAA